MNQVLPDVQAGFRKGRGTREQIAKIHWIIEKAREFQKNIYFCFIDYTKSSDCGSQQTVENSSRDGNTRLPYLPPKKPVCRSEATVRTGHGTTDFPNRERSMSRLYIVILLIYLICRVHHEKHWAG